MVRNRFIDATRDERGPDNDLISGPRLVRKNGRIKFNHIWFQNNNLIPFTGQYIYIDGFELLRISNRKIMVFADYWHKQFICHIDEPKRKFDNG